MVMQLNLRMIFYLLLVSPGFAESTGNLTFSWPYQSNPAEISGKWPEMFGGLNQAPNAVAPCCMKWACGCWTRGNRGRVDSS